jgi:hypothetical protein
MKRVITAVAFVAALLVAQPAKADTWAYTNWNLAGGAPNTYGQELQTWTGNLGLDFNVINPITVTALGVFNQSGTGFVGGTGSIEVAIFSLTSDLAVTPTETFVGGTKYSLTPGKFDIYQTLPTPVTLGPGDYSVVAVGFSQYNPNGNGGFLSPNAPVSTENTLGGNISFAGSARYDYSSTLDLPGIIDGGPTNRYAAGTFATPEPGFYGELAVLGISGLLLVFRRRRQA